MRRRRLRLNPSSSDEENETEIQPQAPPRPNPNNNNTNGDNLTPEDDEDPHPPHPVAQYLRQMGLRLSREWLMDCLARLQSSIQGFQALDVPAISKLCFHQFLFSDMNFSAVGAGVLPPNLNSMHLVFLPGPFVLQVDEIVNISCPLKGRYQPASAGHKRCLKLSLTDGVQRVFGMEYRPIKDLDPLAPAGLKVVVCNVHIRHGLLMLVPESLDVLGGVVDELEAARQRLVNEVNKPPRGKRTRSGTVPPLATRATFAAWPPNGVNTTHNDASPMETATFPRSVGISSTPAVVNTGHRSSANSTVPSGTGNMVRQPSSNFNSDLEDMHVDTVPVRTADAMCSAPVSIAAHFEEMHVDSRSSINRPAVVSNSEHNSVTAAEERQAGADTMERVNALEDPCLDALSDKDDAQIVDGSEHLLLLSGDREVPFTYLAILSAKWVAMKEEVSSVQGKIKCFLTGVKRFQYKKRTTYELQVYVDDGSLISEILIDHNLVQRGIGHPPEEVTAALSSPDKNVVSCMKETLKQFQYFLANFEGIMLLEMNASSPLPVALEMNEGCVASDSWLLLRRMKLFTTERTESVSSVQPIELSP